MANLLAAFQPVLTELIMKVKLASSLNPIPDLNLEIPKDPPKLSGNSITEGRKRVEAKVKDEVKEQWNKIEEDAKKQLEDAQKQLEDMINNCLADNAALVQEIQMQIAELGVALNELAISAAGLPIRFAILAPSIIGACPLGPTVQPTQLVMTLKQFKEIGDDLGTKYSKAQAAFNALSLDQIQQMASSLPVPVPGLDVLMAAISPALTIVKATLDLAKPFIMLVGGGISNISSAMPTSISYRSNTAIPLYGNGGMVTYAGVNCFLSDPDEQGEAEQPETPDVGYEADPENCVVFSPKTYYDDEGHYYRTAANCKNFKVLDKTKTEPDGSIKPDCQNCTKYKEVQPNITKTVTRHENEIYGEEGTKENPKPGSLIYRMIGVEGRCTALETRATNLESRCTTLEAKVSDSVGWSIEVGFDETSDYLWIDLKNSKGEVLFPKSNGHSTWVESSRFSSDTYLDKILRINISKYEKLNSTQQEQVRVLMGWPVSYLPDPNTVWGYDSSTEEVIYKTEEIPIENRIDGICCAVFTLKNTVETDISPVWANVSMLSNLYEFTSSLDSTTQQYMNLDFETVSSRFATSVIASLKYTPPAPTPIA